MIRRVLAAAVLVAWTALVAPVPARAGTDKTDDPAFFTFQAGIFDPIQQHNVAGAFAMEYRDDTKWWIFKPFFGGMGTSDGGAQAYGGILLDVYLWRRVVFTLGFAPSLYHRGNGVDLGFPLEFRSSGELAWRFDDRSRLGLMVNHISNASLGWKNPGTEVVMLSYSIPIPKLLGGK